MGATSSAQMGCIEIARSLRNAADPVAFHAAELTRTLPGLDQWQIDASRDQSPGLLLLCGRQTGKSTLSALVAIWTITQWPDQLVLLISPTLRQSGELFRKAMVILDCLDPNRRPIEKQRSKTEIHLSNGSRMASLPGANPDAIRGYSAPDLIVEDESAFVGDATFTASRPMLATSQYGRHILLSTPFGRRGHFHRLWSNDDPTWRRISIKSEDCTRISKDFLKSEQLNLSERAYRQEYQCEFLESASAVFSSDWVDQMVEPLVDDEARKLGPPEDGQVINLASLGSDPGPWADI